MSKLIGNSAKINKLPDRVTDINLADRLIKFNEKEHMLNIAELTIKYFNDKCKVGKTQHKTPESLRAAKKWESSGQKPVNYWSEERLKQEIAKGVPFSASVYLPNNNICGITIFNRTGEIKFGNAIINMNTRGGLFWDALHITVVVYKDTYITVIGNHCIVKSIFQEGYGALVPCNVIYLGDDEEEVLKYMAKIHDSDANKRTNQSALDRVVSQTHAGDPVGEDTMKTMIALGYNVKGQVVPNGLDLKVVSSHQVVKGLVNSYGFDVVERASNIMRYIWKNDEEINASALEVITRTLHYFSSQINKVGNGKDIFQAFMNFKVKFTGMKQKSLLIETGKNKDPMISVCKLINDFNDFVCSESVLNAKDEDGKPLRVKVQNNRPIGLKLFTNIVPESELPNNISILKG